MTFSRRDRIREVINNLNEDGFESLYPNTQADALELSPPAPAPGHTNDRPVAPDGPRAFALFKLEPGGPRRVSGR